MKPEWFISNCARLNLTPVGRKIFNAVGQKLIATKGVAVKIDNLNNVIWACLTMFLAKVQRVYYTYFTLSFTKSWLTILLND